MERLLLVLLLLLPTLARAQMLDEEEIGKPGMAPRSIPLNTSGNVAAALAQIPVAPSACWNFNTDVAATLTANCGGTEVLTKGGTPVKTALPLWPNGVAAASGNGWDFGATTGIYAYRADTGAGDLFDPPGSFSIVCALTPKILTDSVHYIIAKLNSTGNQRSWSIYTYNNSLYFELSDDGTGGAGHYLYNQVPTSYYDRQPVFFTSTYTYVADGSSINNFYVDNNATDTLNTFDGPAFDSTANFSIGSSAVGANLSPGLIHFCAYYPGTVITRAQHDAAFAAYQGRMSGWNGNYVTFAGGSTRGPTIAMAPPDSGIFPFLVAQPLNSSYIGKLSSTIFGMSRPTLQGSNQIGRGPFESCTLNSNTEPDGWTVAESSAGSGDTIDIACTTTEPLQGRKSLKATISGTGSSGSIKSICRTLAATSVYVDFWARTTSGTGAINVSLMDDDTADCSSPNTTAWFTCNPTSTPTHCRPSGTLTMTAGTSRVQVLIAFPAGAAQTTYIDAVYLGSQSTPMSSDGSCLSDSDSVATCGSPTTHTITSPVTWKGSVSVTATESTLFDGTSYSASGAQLWSMGTKDAANTVTAMIAGATDEPSLQIVDAGSAVMTVAPDVANWAKNTPYALKWRWTNTGIMGLWWNSAWNTTTAGAGTGIVGTLPTVINFPGETWIHDFVVKKGLVP
jgi:hypothetical protein